MKPLQLLGLVLGASLLSLRCMPEEPQEPSLHIQSLSTLPRVWVITDLRKFGDPDDKVALAWFFLAANEFDVEGVVVGATTASNTSDAANWTRNELLPAYTAERPNLEATYGPFPDIPILQASTGSTYFDVNRNYNLSSLPSVQAARDALTQGPLFFLIWGPTTEAAVLVKSLLDAGDTTRLIGCESWPTGRHLTHRTALTTLLPASTCTIALPRGWWNTMKLELQARLAWSNRSVVRLE